MRLQGLQDQRQLAALGLDLNLVAVLHHVGRDVHPLAVHQDMAVVHELAGGEDGRHELGAVDHRVQAALQHLDEVLAGVALAAPGLLVIAAELALADVAVVALQLLLGGELGAEIRRLAAALAVLAGTVFTLVEGALGATPEIDAETAVDLVLSGFALGHGCFPLPFLLVSR